MKLLAGLIAASMLGAPALAQYYSPYDRYGRDLSVQLPGADEAIAEALGNELGRTGWWGYARAREAYRNAVESCGIEATHAARADNVQVTHVERIGRDRYAVIGTVGADDDGGYDPEPLAWQTGAMASADDQDPAERYYVPNGQNRQATPAPQPRAADPQPAPSHDPGYDYQPEQSQPFDWGNGGSAFDQDQGQDGGQDQGDDDGDDDQSGAQFTCVAWGDGQIAAFDFGR